MNPSGFGSTLEEYKALEVALHRDLMEICRGYINKIGIVSVLGILDIVKQETIELHRATRKNIDRETPKSEIVGEPDIDFS